MGEEQVNQSQAISGVLTHTKSGLTTPFLVETRQMVEGRLRREASTVSAQPNRAQSDDGSKEEKSSGKKGVIKADLVSGENELTCHQPVL